MYTEENANVIDAIAKPTVIGGFFLVSEDKEFKFKNLCPYCKGNLTYRCNGWDIECSTKPDMESDDWEDWIHQHSEMPYVYQLPVDEKVKDFINKKYRFDLMSADIK